MAKIKENNMIPAHLLSHELVDSINPGQADFIRHLNQEFLPKHPDLNLFRVLYHPNLPTDDFKPHKPIYTRVDYPIGHSMAFWYSSDDPTSTSYEPINDLKSQYFDNVYHLHPNVNSEHSTSSKSRHLLRDLIADARKASIYAHLGLNEFERALPQKDRSIGSFGLAGNLLKSGRIYYGYLKDKFEDKKNKLPKGYFEPFYFRNWYGASHMQHHPYYTLQDMGLPELNWKELGTNLFNSKSINSEFKDKIARRMYIKYLADTLQNATRSPKVNNIGDYYNEEENTHLPSEHAIYSSSSDPLLHDLLTETIEHMKAVDLPPNKNPNTKLNYQVPNIPNRLKMLE